MVVEATHEANKEGVEAKREAKRFLGQGTSLAMDAHQDIPCVIWQGPCGASKMVLEDETR